MVKHTLSKKVDSHLTKVSTFIDTVLETIHRGVFYDK